MAHSLNSHPQHPACNKITHQNREVGAGATGFAGKINGEIDVTLTQPEFYAVKRKTHFGLGMVIAVGDDAAATDSFLEGKIPKKARA